MIEVTAVAGSLLPSKTRPLLEDLATILLRWEGAPDTEFFREVTWVYLNEIAADQLAVGGRAGGAPRFRVEITVPEGALSQRRKAGLLADVHTAVVVAAGLDPHSARAMHVWTLIHEVPEGNWGVAGQPVTAAALRGVSAAERDKAGAAQ
ncbi:tautomerase family protein [Nocardia jejuensis]|uniref:tautomerase family protein n=1 Tax=Nocardia jejuensis TaxID=328049 RepID=UPI001C3FEC41|nr:tautomerase family protein [Nocardia jejuensis]